MEVRRDNANVGILAHDKRQRPHIPPLSTKLLEEILEQEGPEEAERKHQEEEILEHERLEETERKRQEEYAAYLIARFQSEGTAPTREEC
jgi:hypothetical protein